MPGITRDNDQISNGVDIAGTTQTSVFINQVRAVRQPDQTKIKGTTYRSPVSPNVYIGNQPTVRLGDVTFANDIVNQSSDNVFANSGAGAGALLDNNVQITTNTPPAVIPSTIQPTFDPSYVASNPPITVVEGLFYETDDPESPGPSPPNTVELPREQVDPDPKPPPASGTPVHSCPDVSSLPNSFNWVDDGAGYPNTFAGWQDWSSGFQLSPNFTVYSLSAGTAVSRYKFTNSVVQQGSDNLTQKQTLANLCYHANVVLEPIFAYALSEGLQPVVTSAFRSQAGGSQHNKGQATDIQFLALHNNNTGRRYYELAQYIRENFNFDQMILEWFGKNPWIHISSNPAGHRHVVLTQVGQSSFQPGLILLR